LRREPSASDGWFSEELKMAGQRPVTKFAAGQVSAAIWENEVTTRAGRKVTMLKATVERRYKDRDGQWKSSGSFSRDEIPFAIYTACRRASTISSQPSRKRTAP
jgi:hypothetical protein